MAWLYNNKTIQVGRSWKDSKGVKHPRTWSNWTAERKAQVGLTFKADPVVESYDERFFSDLNVAKPLNDTPAKDDKGNAMMDLDGTPMITEGLKTSAVKQAKATAAAMLKPTDWYVTRYAEVGTEVPAEVLSQREAIRTACGVIEAAINGATTHAQFIKLYEATVDTQGKVTAPAPINNWPGA